MANDAGGLVFVPEKLSGGMFFVGEKKEYNLVLKNLQAKDLSILEIETDCDCMQVSSEPELIKAKNTAEIKLSYLSKKEVAAQVKVTVKYYDGNNEYEAQLDFSADVRDREIDKAHFNVTADKVIPKSNIVVVDVRSPDQFSKAHISDSLNFPLFAVKTKTVLSSAQLLLVGNGYLDESLYIEAQAMENLGFKNVKVLVGGIRAWENAGGKIDRLRYVNLGLIPASSVSSIEKDSEWKIIQVSDDPIASKSKTPNKTTPEPVAPNFRLARVDAVVSSKALSNQLDQLTGKVLLVATTDQMSRSVLESLSLKPSVVLFSDEGGLPAIEMALREKSLIGDSTTVRVQGIKQIGAPGRGATKKGCGSCQ